ncbi:DUF2058 family protein [Thiofilum flexile]|uniref:DUF2058 family protein n=1 Tax=Thiofilum flexile TaxID=125627 RepID=UPI00037FE4FE|nr:DUF2058 family protein [Thiofilum flexile]
MSNSLRDQLLKAGLATQAQVDQAEQDKQRPPSKKSTERSAQRTPPARSAKPQQMPKAKKPAPPAEEDLAQFYSARDKAERAEKLEQERRQREASERKKQVRQQVKTLLEGQVLNQPEAEIRYNFVVGETIKYLYVTAEQQTQLAQGLLAITFLEGKRCLISLELAQQVKAIDPDKLIIIADPNDESEELPDVPEEQLITPTETQSQAI